MVTKSVPGRWPDGNIIEVKPLHFVYKRERDTRCSANEEKDEEASRAEPASCGNDSGKATPEFVYKRERDSISCDFP